MSTAASAPAAGDPGTATVTDGSDGETETTPTTTTSPAPADTTSETDVSKLQAELEKWREQSQKQERRAKENAQKAKDYDSLKAQSMTEQEKAVKAAREEGRAEALRESGTMLAEAAIRVAVGTRVTPKQLDGLLEAIDASKFIDDDGRPDKEAIQKWVDRVAPEPAEPGPAAPAKPRDLGQGARGQAVPLNGSQLENDLRQALGVL